MAVAAFATTRCSAFFHSGSRMVRPVSRAGTHFARPLTGAIPQVEQMTQAREHVNGRVNADDLSLDTLLISKNPDLVLGHLNARRMGQESTDAVRRIGGNP